MLAHERNDYILTKLNAKGCVNVRHLSQELAVSEVTIRRDLEEMEKQGLLIRIHGGAKKIRKRISCQRMMKAVCSIAYSCILNRKTAFVSKQQNSSRMGIVFFGWRYQYFSNAFVFANEKD